MRVFAQVAGWVLRILGITLDLKEILFLALWNGGGGAVISTGLKFLTNIPTWMIIIIFFVLTGIIAIVWQILQRKYKGDNRLQIIPRILRKMHKRIRRHVEKSAVKGIDDDSMVQVVLDLSEMIGVSLDVFTEKQPSLKTRLEKITKETEDTMLSQLEEGFKSANYDDNYLPEDIRWAVAIGNRLDRRGIGLKQLLERDWGYKILLSELDAFKPLPVSLSNDVWLIQNHIYGGNSMLIFIHYFNTAMGGIAPDMVSPKISTRLDDFNRSLLDETVERKIAKLNEKIKEILKQNEH